MKKFLGSAVIVGFLFASGFNPNLSKIIPDKNTVLVNEEYIDGLSKGWNLIGVEHNITDLSILKNIDIAWMYNNKTKKWEVYSPMPDIDIDALPYRKITSIPAGSGIWVYRKINLPKFTYLNYDILEKNNNEMKVELKVNIDLPKDNNLFYEEKTYDNGKEINLKFLPSFDENYSIADVNLTRGYHKITICEGIGSANFSPATVRYNVCKSIGIGTDLPDFDENDINHSNMNAVTNLPPYPYIYELYGNVTDIYNNSLKNVKIVLQLPDENITTLTNENGDYNLSIDENISFPVLVTAYKDGYLPESKNIFKQDTTNYKIDFQLKPQNDEIVIDKSLHHLGDDNYGGTINSQFQAKSEGIVYTKEFNLSNEFLNTYKNAILSFYMKGAQYNNPLYINGKLITSLNNSPDDGSFGVYSVKIPISDLKNQNILKIESSTNGSSDYDDFEFANIQLKGE